MRRSPGRMITFAGTAGDHLDAECMGSFDVCSQLIAT